MRNIEQKQILSTKSLSITHSLNAFHPYGAFCSCVCCFHYCCYCVIVRFGVFRAGVIVDHLVACFATIAVAVGVCSAIVVAEVSVMQLGQRLQVLQCWGASELVEMPPWSPFFVAGFS